MSTVSPLLYAASAHDADSLYFGDVSVPDPFIAFGVKGRKVAVVSALEFGRVKRDSAFDEVLPLEDWLEQAKKAYPKHRPGPAIVIALLQRKYRVARFTIPHGFSAGLAAELTGLKVKFEIAAGALFPEREIKTPAEAKAIAEGNRCSAIGIAAAGQVLREAKIKGRTLVHRGEVLTSERLKFFIESACLEAGGLSIDTICAGGDQACDPHDRGSGPLRPNELIIVDVFPRINATGFHGDMTRTFLKGRASDAQRALVQAVADAQKAALGKIKAGVNGRDVHQACIDVFTSRGFKTERKPQGSVGFFHGTGHGLGLEVHEPPRMAHVDYALKAGSVVTVEPGLYYPGLGGCRIEDVVQVTRSKPKMLSSAPYEWELK